MLALVLCLFFMSPNLSTVVRVFFFCFGFFFLQFWTFLGAVNLCPLTKCRNETSRTESQPVGLVSMHTRVYCVMYLDFIPDS